MSVYKEGYWALNEIKNKSVQIYPDACDFGAPTKKGDVLWNAAKQLVEWYGDKKTRKENRYGTGYSVSQKVTLMDEWAVSDERKTIKEATEQYVVGFVSCTSGRCKGYDGYITVNNV